MEELKIIYDIISGIWKLFRKYGTRRLDDAKWEALLKDGNTLGRGVKQKGEEYYLLFYDLWVALRNFYQRKEVWKDG